MGNVNDESSSDQLSLMRFFESLEKTILGKLGRAWLWLFMFCWTWLLLLIWSICCSFWAAYALLKLSAFCCCWATWKSRYCFNSWPDIWVWPLFYIKWVVGWARWIESWSGPWSWDGISIILRGACCIWSCCGCWSWLWLTCWVYYIFWMSIGWWTWLMQFMSFTGFIIIYFFWGNYCWTADYYIGNELIRVLLLQFDIPWLVDTVLVKSWPS